MNIQKLKDLAVFFAGDSSMSSAETDKAFMVEVLRPECNPADRDAYAATWLPKSQAMEVIVEEVRPALIAPEGRENVRQDVIAKMERACGVFVLCPTWLGRSKGLQLVGMVDAAKLSLSVAS